MKTLVCLCSLCLVGCESLEYRAETKLYSDGRIDRAITQPRAESPSSVLDSKLWKTVALTAEASDPAIPAASSQIDSKNHCKYILAKQSFANYESIPQHLLISSSMNPDCPPVKLLRAYDKRHVAFITEHDWRETITESFDILKARKARIQLADEFIDLFTHAFNELHGSDLDASGLVSWLRGEGKTWWTELTDMIDVEAAAGKLRENEKALEGIVARVCRQHGLDIGSDNSTLQAEERDARINAFASDLIAKHIRGKDGKPIPIPRAREMWMEIHDGPSTPSAQETWKKLETIAHKKYGGKDGFEKFFSHHIVTSFGLAFFDAGRHRFDYRMTVPGFIVETAGILTTPSSVRWKCTLADTYPLGYVMRCRSLEPNLMLQKQVLGKTPILSLEQMVEFLVLMEDAAVQRDVREIVEKKTLAPLLERKLQLQQKMKNETSAEDRESASRALAVRERLLRLLGE